MEQPTSSIKSARLRSISGHSSSRGFTLAESLTASVILAMAVVATATAINASFEQSAYTRERATATLLARQLMEEIAAKPFADAGGTMALTQSLGATPRSQFDHIGDYNNYTDTTDAVKNLENQTVQNLGSGGRYTRLVKVEYRATLTGTGTTGGDYAMVTVTVTPPHGQAVRLNRLFTRTVLSF